MKGEREKAGIEGGGRFRCQDLFERVAVSHADWDFGGKEGKKGGEKLRSTTTCIAVRVFAAVTNEVRYRNFGACLNRPRCATSFCLCWGWSRLILLRTKF